MARDADGRHEANEVVAEKDDVRTFTCDIGPGAHGYADIRFNKGGSIVYTVAQHRNHTTLSNQCGDPRELVFR